MQPLPLAPHPTCAERGHIAFRAAHVLVNVPDREEGEDIEIRSDQHVSVCGRCGLVMIETQGLRREIVDFARAMQDAIDAAAASKGERWRDQGSYGLADDVKRKAFRLQSAIANGDQDAAHRIAADLGNYAWMSVARMSVKLSTPTAEEAPSS